MDSLHDWRYMMRLILAPKTTKGIEEKLLKSQSRKLWQKYLQKSQKLITMQLNKGDDSNQKDNYIDANQGFTRCANNRNILPLF
jgi:hypothetical protein